MRLSTFSALRRDLEQYCTVTVSANVVLLIHAAQRQRALFATSNYTYLSHVHAHPQATDNLVHQLIYTLQVSINQFLSAWA